ncbi:MAG TPA: 30S ribosomal protein S17 [Candidatus Nanoarchaeia archaeon]|nr:30S ribosomal protein S17P [uncultured archaeon]HLD37047.1 30S ribosomal protein S17 [Candidatus Nanoarchaeia archaeon]
MATKARKKEAEKNSGKKEAKETESVSCNDIKCPFHGTLSVRGRTFEGRVIKKFPKRAVIEFERVVYSKKYERYSKARTRIHAKLPDCLSSSVKVGDYIQVRECRPLSKIIRFVVLKKTESGKDEKPAGAEK